MYGPLILNYFIKHIFNNLYGAIRISNPLYEEKKKERNKEVKKSKVKIFKNILGVKNNLLGVERITFETQAKFEPKVKEKVPIVNAMEFLSSPLNCYFRHMCGDNL